MIRAGLWRASRARHLIRALWLLAIVVVGVASLLPGDSLPMQALDRLEISDKIEHFAAYAVLAFLPALHERRRFVVLSVLAAAFLGVALEYGQLYTGWRDFEIGDMAADVAGVLFGLAVGMPLRSARLIRSIFGTGSASVSEPRP